MAEVRTEYAEVVRPSISRPDDGLWTQLIGNAGARRKVMPVHVLDTMIGNASHSKHVDQAVVGVKCCAVARRGCLGEHLLPAHTKAHRELRRGAPLILAIPVES